MFRKYKFWYKISWVFFSPLALTIALLNLTSIKMLFGQTLGKSSKQEVQIVKFLGHDLVKSESSYIVKTEVNIRVAPKTSSKKLGTFKKYDRINAIGEAPGAWVAVTKDGKDFGFVYKPALLFVLEGELKSNLVGELKNTKRPDCKYTISFIGKSPAEGQIFKMIDYGVEWNCLRKSSKIKKIEKAENVEEKRESDRQHIGEVRNKKKGAKSKSKSYTVKKNSINTIGNSSDLNSRAKFYTPMFLSEGSHGSAKRNFHQITIDLIDSPYGSEGIVSTTSFYGPKEEIVEFKEVSVRQITDQSEQTKIKVTSVPGALRASVKLAYEAWGMKFWDYVLNKQN